MNKKYQQLSEFVGGMSSAGISGTYETLAGAGKNLFRQYNHDDEDEKPKKTKVTDVVKIINPSKSSTQKMKP